MMQVVVLSIPTIHLAKASNPLHKRYHVGPLSVLCPIYLIASGIMVNSYTVAAATILCNAMHYTHLLLRQGQLWCFHAHVPFLFTPHAALEVYVPILEARVKNLEDQLHNCKAEYAQAELRNELNESAKKNVSLQEQLKEAMDTSLKNIRTIETYYPIHAIHIKYNSTDGIDTHMEGLFHSDVRLLVV